MKMTYIRYFTTGNVIEISMKNCFKGKKKFKAQARFLVQNTERTNRINVTKLPIESKELDM